MIVNVAAAPDVAPLAAKSREPTVVERRCSNGEYYCPAQRRQEEAQHPRAQDASRPMSTYRAVFWAKDRSGWTRCNQ